jgi:integrase
MRTIGLSAEAVAVLQRWRGDRIPSGLVFPGRSGHGGISHNTVVRATEKVAERIGVKRLEPHEYRATMASVALGRGANRKQVADHLGHANVNELPTYEKRTADLDVERFAGRGVA